MLEYVKTILQKVSFDRHLFEKELRKGVARLMPEEVRKLKAWCYTKFRHRYRDELDRVFLVYA